MQYGQPTGGVPAAGVGNFVGLQVNGKQVIDIGAPATLDSGNGVGSAITIFVTGTGTLNPDPRTGQWVEATGSTDFTVALMASDGVVTVVVPATVSTVTLNAGYTELVPRTTDSRTSLLQLWRGGLTYLATWV